MWPIRSEFISGFSSMNRLGVIQIPPHPPDKSEMLVHRRVSTSIIFAGTSAYTWVERSTVGVKYLNEFKPTQLDPESSALPMPPRLRNYAKMGTHKPDMSAVKHDVSKFVHSLGSKTFLFAKLQHFWGGKHSFQIFTPTQTSSHYCRSKCYAC